MSCLVLIRTDVDQRTEGSIRGSAPKGYGFGPAQLQSAYNLPSSTDGAGESVAVVDAFDNPDAVSDLAVYRKAWGLPACNTSTGAGCLTKVNQEGKASPLPAPSGTTGWATEESLDVDMVSAICPKCHIYLVEAVGPSNANLGTGVDAAVKVLHVKFVSNSYGGPQKATDPTFDTKYFNHPGVAVVASAGDSGYGVGYPAASQYVTAAGGTDLTKAPGTARGWTETVWAGSGSGCSEYEAKPSWQTDKGCSKRTDNDVAADADPGTGVAIYDTYDQGGWLEVGGTSVSSPIIASVFALAGKPKKGTYPSSYPYAHTSDLNDVTSGKDGTCSPAYLCTGEVGYDGPTGWGTPNGIGAFTG
jgi:subtilase family serine protease